MADITDLTFSGDWRITVHSKDAGWGQRLRAIGTANGDVTLAGNPGASVDVFGPGQGTWQLRIEHNDGQHGWQPSWLRETVTVFGASFARRVESEDNTTANSDRDFNDLVIVAEKLGAVAQPVPPFAIRPDVMQAMPEGIFEVTLGRYFAAIEVSNMWTIPWPSSARIGVSDRCRAWLAAAGVTVVDAWFPQEQAAVGQSVVGGQVVVGSLGPWQNRRIYLKLDVSAAAPRKHQLELQLFTDQGAEPIALLSRRARAPISVSRTTYDSQQSAFVSECDVGVLTASIREMTVDLTTFKRAMQEARRLFQSGSSGGSSGSGGTPIPGCDQRTMEWVRAQLRAFLAGKAVDLCAVLRVVSCCCAGERGGRDPSGGGDWTSGGGPALTFFVWPSIVDYTVEYRPPFAGQFGPIPFEDPWWKVLLLIIAIILSLAAAASSVADLANRSDDVVIGTVNRAVLNALSSRPATNPSATDPGSVDATVAKLNGNRSLTPMVFSFLDAASGEAATTPIVSLGGRIDSPGTIVTNVQISAIFQNLADNPTDPAAQAAVRAFKCGARSGTSTALLSSIIPVQPRGPEKDGSTVFFLNQITFAEDSTGAATSCAGDSGSLWLQQGTLAILGLNHAGSSDESGSTAIACRIEDVLNALGIRFA